MTPHTVTAQSKTESTRCCSIQRTATVEDYLKAVFVISSRDITATTSAIAGRLEVAPPTVTAMLHRLRDAGLVEQVSWGHVALTPHGLDHAHDVVRRHRVLETFLHEVLGVGWDEVHDEAEVLEHHLSPRLEHLMDKALGFPDRDPHGDLIPRPSLAHEMAHEMAYEIAQECDSRAKNAY